MKSSVRILVLETDYPLAPIHSTRGSYGEIFGKLFSKVGSELDPPIDVETVPCYVVGHEDSTSKETGELPDIKEVEEYDGILITGSKYDAHGDDPWIHRLIEWIRTAWESHPHIRFSGVCFGHQIISRSLGAQVSQNPNSWELAHTHISLTPLGQALFSTGDKGSIYLHQMHQDHVVDPPHHSTSNGLLKEHNRVHVWGESKDCKIQGLYIPKRIFTSQGHLGYDEEMVKRNIDARHKNGSVETEHAEDAKERAGMEHDGEVVAGAILRFFNGRDDRIE
ncbi:GMP synthase [Morchella conica CCBAS932]|uniref:GMP synthase n=1 Tax=Morchella conica CCBAS932 TaxID=1392247 RepID=A0A3N4KTW6_9PEZI|nr:GMP synthase [Morchella conica CCBAS932]